MTKQQEPDPSLPVPTAAAVHSHIGRLLRELRLARRLLKVAKDAEELHANTDTTSTREAVSCAAN